MSDDGKHKTDRMVLEKTCQKIEEIGIAKWTGFMKLCTMYQLFTTDKGNRSIIREELKSFYLSGESFYSAEGYMNEKNLMREMNDYLGIIAGILGNSITEMKACF